jgi:hypothetical protein
MPVSCLQDFLPVYRRSEMRCARRRGAMPGEASPDNHPNAAAALSWPRRYLHACVAPDRRDTHGRRMTDGCAIQTQGEV